MPRDIESEDHLPPRPAAAPWTASRCNRTLRQLNSFVKRLEKWHKDYLALQTQTEAEEDEKERNAEPTTKDGEEEIAWLSNPTGRRNGKTKKSYASRQKIMHETPAAKRRPLARSIQRTPNAYTQLSDATLLKTPADTFVGDTLNHGYTARKNVLHSGISKRQDPRIDSEVRTKESTSLTRSRAGILRNGYTVIISFLIATSDPKLPTQWKGSRNEEAKVDERGAKSLALMCLAKVSQNMIEEQKQSDAKHDGYEGQCDVVDSELEALQDYFGDSKRGWPPLRTVTRTYGIAMVSRLIESGAFPKDDASDLAIRAFGSPLLADFGEAITEVLMRLDANGYGTSPFQDGGSAMRAFRSYTFDEGDGWRQLMQFRWLTLAMRQEINPVPFVSQLVRYRELSMGFFFCIKLDQVAAAELIGTTYSRALFGDCRASQERLRLQSEYPQTTAHVCCEGTCAEQLTRELDKRLKLTSRLFFAFKPEGPSHLLQKICTQVQVFMELHVDQVIPQCQKLIIAQLFFINMILALVDGQKVESSLQACFQELLSECDSEVEKQIETLLISTLLYAPFPTRLFMEVISRMAIKCEKEKSTGKERLHALLARVCSEAAMDYATDYATDKPEIHTFFRTWASAIEEKARDCNFDSVYNGSTPPDVQQFKARTGYRWDEDVREWVERTPKKALCVLTATQINRLNKACASCSSSKNAPLSESEGTKDTDHRFKRKSSRYDFELHRDDDFEYKKPRLKVPKSDIEENSKASTDFNARSSRGCPRLKLYHDEESADELSLLA